MIFVIHANLKPVQNSKQYNIFPVFIKLSNVFWMSLMSSQHRMVLFFTPTVYYYHTLPYNTKQHLIFPYIHGGHIHQDHSTSSLLHNPDFQLLQESLSESLYPNFSSKTITNINTLFIVPRNNRIFLISKLEMTFSTLALTPNSKSPNPNIYL